MNWITFISFILLNVYFSALIKFSISIINLIDHFIIIIVVIIIYLKRDKRNIWNKFSYSRKLITNNNIFDKIMNSWTESDRFFESRTKKTDTDEWIHIRCIWPSFSCSGLNERMKENFLLKHQKCLPFARLSPMFQFSESKKKHHISSKSRQVFSTGFFTKWLQFCVNLKALNLFPFIQILFDKCTECSQTNSW